MLIYLENPINASPQDCFNLARDIDLHEQSMQNTAERLVAGVTSGLIGLGDFLTRESKHFGFTIRLSSKITELKPPEIFVAEQLQGPFKRLHHAHIFKPMDSGTLMIDRFDYDLPLGWLGRLFGRLVVKRHITKLLKHRNQILKAAAEAAER